LLEPIGETVKVVTYERKTPLVVAKQALGNMFTKVQPADCIVCFSKKEIFAITRQLQKRGINPAVIYGSLPPGAKLAQAAKFNDPNDPCNVLVATDAIGMGLNLNIRRIIFRTITRSGKLVPNYAALQIAGRAGRYGTKHEQGVVTTVKPGDLSLLETILAKPVEPIKAVGIAPNFEQIEEFSFHLREPSFLSLLDMFDSICSVSDHFFLCTIPKLKEMATAINDIPLTLKVRHTLCTSPITLKQNKFLVEAFVNIARRFSSGQPLTADWLFEMVGWNPRSVNSLEDLAHLENVYPVLETYLWLSLRYPDMLPDEEIVRDGSIEIDNLIREGMDNVSKLLPDVKQGSSKKRSKRKAETARGSG
ncbi:hypothetical protein PMAYCL1PPCAC_01761, partial [Pristionchus mayeri]